MKIKKIIIDNIRSFKHLEIDLTGEKGINNWTVFLGNNGVGKTTILRCIALCLCEKSAVAGLLAELEGEWIRKDAYKKVGLIKIEFEKTKGYSGTPFIETKISLSKLEEIEVTQTTKPIKSDLWDQLFVCGYGANRRSYGTTSYAEYTGVDSIYSLFNYAANMQNVELVMRRLDKELDLQSLFRALENILLLERNSIKLARNGITIKGSWGSYMPLGTLGDGYQSMLAWIMDMYGWYFLFKKKMETAEINGIVIVDEIEQHLHPMWQKEVVSRLSKQFKGIQFFVATHSPIVALNSFPTTEDDPISKLYYISWTKNRNDIFGTISEVQEPINQLDYNQLLESEAFGHMINANSKVEKLLKEMSELASVDTPTKEQAVLLEKLKKEMKNIMFPLGKTLIERTVEREYYKELENKANDLNKLLQSGK